jgi:hypothetical protein
MAMQWLSLGAIALIAAAPAQAHAAEERPPAATEQLERVFVGVPTQLTLPPDLAVTHADSVTNRTHCDAVANVKQSKGRRVAMEHEGGDVSCPSDPHVVGGPPDEVMDAPKTSEHRGR